MELRLGHRPHLVDAPGHPLDGGRDRDPRGDAVGIRVGRLGVDRVAGVEAAHHRVGRLSLDPDDAAFRERVPQPRADPVDQGPIADRDRGDARFRQVAGLDGIRDLEGHRRRAGRDPDVITVDEELDIVLGPVVVGRGSGGIEVVAGLDHLRAEGTHPVDLAAVRTARNEDDRGDTQCTRGVSDALAEVAGRHAQDRPIGGDAILGRETVDRQPRAATLKGADRVHRLDLDDDRDAEPAGQALVDVLGGTEESRVDPIAGGTDRRGVELGDRDHAGWLPGHAADTKTLEGTARP